MKKPVLVIQLAALYGVVAHVVHVALRGQEPVAVEGSPHTVDGDVSLVDAAAVVLYIVDIGIDFLNHHSSFDVLAKEGGGLPIRGDVRINRFRLPKNALDRGRPVAAPNQKLNHT